MTSVDTDKVTDRGFRVPEIPIAVSENSGDSGAGAMAPLIFNAWYVIALSENVGRSLGSVKALGEPLVYFRAEDGQPVVLDDRCAHRRFPLSKSRLIGDTIQCGYHGFTYDKSGQCIWACGVPINGAGDTKLPFGVRAYPCAERGPWLWVWMGRPELADPAKIPLPEMQSGYSVCGYKMNPANYLMLIENLLDLSHLHFLHQAQDLEYGAMAPSPAPAPADGVAWKKSIEQTEIGPIIGGFCGGDPTHVVRQEDETIQYGPSLTFGIQRRETLPGDDRPAKPALMEIAHALTPMDSRNTHQFFTVVMSDPFVIDASAVLRAFQDVVFEEDVEALRDVQASVDGDVRLGRVEFNMAGDRFAVRMRQILKDLKEQELSAC